ncbi:ABC transporter transmembrane domain-containing protein [Salininema proteolyticum]|uniref:ABC transporter transmembrane domain-containing protein n=1 Tax=Salininema proteolyticum TaxID=1607685 RepID=A0ABV8U5D0_9ACTN
MRFWKSSTIPYRDPGSPPRSLSAWGLFRWVGRKEPFLATVSIVSGALGLGSIPLISLFLNGAVDSGLGARDGDALVRWVVGLVLAGAASSALILVNERSRTLWTIKSASRVIQLVDRKANRLGSALTGHADAGKVVAVGVVDATAIGAGLNSLGVLAGAVFSIALVGGLLFAISLELGLTIFVGTAVLAVINGPLVSRLRKKQAGYREAKGELASTASDIVAGLRVLRGIGGEDRFSAHYRNRSRSMMHSGIRLAKTDATIRSLTEAGLTALLAAVVWVGARQAVAGDITTGQLIASFSYCTVLLLPVAWSTYVLRNVLEGGVAAAKLRDFLALPEPETPAEPAAFPDGARVHEPESGLELTDGLTVIAAESPREAVEAFARITAHSPGAATVDGVKATDIDRAELRRHVLLGDHDAYLFAGTVGENIAETPGGVKAALETANASDIVEALAEGTDTKVENQIRTVSGGQRQRLRLARAVAYDSRVLLLPEPTSAVDSHTEARIAQRVAKARRGKTTAVASTSPLWLAEADRVAFLRDGKVAATGTHAELLRDCEEYRRLVARESR